MNPPVDRIIEVHEGVGNRLGAMVVGRAWTDPGFKQRLLENASKACREIGMVVEGEDMVVVENTDGVHNVIVCSLSRCYPWPVLGPPPKWFRDPSFRARMLMEPRTLLRDEFGVELPDSTKVRVWDANGELRYWVLPRRPQGTEGMSEAELAELVTWDSLIGVALPRPPRPYRLLVRNPPPAPRLGR